MRRFLQVDLWTTATTLLVGSSLPFLTNCAPAPDRLGATDDQLDLDRRQLLGGIDGLLDGLPLTEAAVTQIVVSTVMETRTATTYTTVVTASSTFDPSQPASASTVSDPAQATGSFALSASSGSITVTSTLPSTADTQTTQILDSTTTIMAPTSDAMSTASSESPPSALLPTPMPSSSSSPSASSSVMLSSAATSSSISSMSPTSSSVPESSSAPVSSTTGDVPDSASPSANPGVFRPGEAAGHAVVQKPLVMAYYPDWAASTFPPENIDFSRFDWIDFAFAVPTENFGLGWDGDGNTPDLLRRLVSAAHQSGKRVKLSVGGWTGSKYFSSAVSSAQNRQNFANNLLAAYNQFGLDGIDIDWEFPAQDGNKGNIQNPNDSSNYLAFLQLLRKTLPPAAKISAATMTVPWSDSQGNPLRDVSAFASVLDWILLMNYDTWGSSSVPGPNAPLSNACHNSTQSSASAVAGVMSWTSAGFPVSKIVMGVPSYGYISRSGASSLMTRSVSEGLSRRRQRRTTTQHVPMHLDGASQEAEVAALGEEGPLAETEGAKPGSPNTPPAYMVQNEDGGTDDGQVQFRELINQKVLQYLTAFSTSSRSGVGVASNENDTSPAEDETDDEAQDGIDADDTSDTDARLDSGPTTDGIDGGEDSQVGLTSIAFAGQQIVNVYNGQNGFVRQWDACSSTPFLRSGAARQVITYDDPQSLEMKAVFVRAAGLLGVNLFDVHGDTDHWDLTDSIRRGLGL